jgi:hypothetical protein
MSQFAANPSEVHIQKSLHIIKYVASTLDSNITYQGATKEGFVAYAGLET